VTTDATFQTRALNALSLFGLSATVLMLVCYALEDRSPWYVLGFAVACVRAGLYAFLQGAWPLGLVEIVFTIVALRRWRLRLKPA
jgi:hypothetical protein